ncbi:hypothetical protein DMP07_01950 [Slackia faecicanis]|uniref:Zinc finger Sec23/Sec24-type domain-containing protein n=1 Tax=Slackia faecicanis TaxID=255723 RepID=A0A3N0AHK1_9ACTN|nr:Sec23/Sec24 zinc finger-containing protein [Slackia faecicanis]RNL21617.1 hypothetical protein DMP07_01950 [Slackia faecicanis]
MGLLDAILDVISSGDDGGCDWYCDNCGAYMNDQPGFTVSGGSWECAACGEDNDVSLGNVIDVDDEDDGYIGSHQGYLDEEKRRREEEEDLWELGMDPNDDQRPLNAGVTTP